MHRSKHIFRGFLLVLICLSIQNGYGQSTSWTGTTNEKWRTASNWTNGVPSSTTDVIIGDANFTGANQPTLRAGSGQGYCKSITIGNSTKSSYLTIKDKLDVSGDVLIGSNGTIDQDGGNFSISGDWLNSGAYIPKNASTRVYFTGTSQTIGGSTVTDFERLYINSGNTVTLGQDVMISTFISLSGTFDPTENFSVTGSGDVVVNAGGTLKVMASTFGGNYDPTVTIDLANSSSIVDYASTTVNQTIDNSITYQTLNISGTTTKTPGNNLSIQNELNINSGTLDLGTFTANRTTAGGNLTIASGASLKIGGTNTFPTNYSTSTLSNTSTVEYYGGNQTVADESYGNLILSSSSGVVVKTMPSNAMTINGNLTSSVSSGFMSFTALNNIDILGNINLGSNSIFDGGTGLSHSTSGNWVNNGTYNGCNSTFSFNGVGTTISGTGTTNFGDLVITGSGTVLNLNYSLNLCGNFSTSGGGTFTHTAGGTGNITMSGTSKTISGTNISFSNFIITGSISTTSSFTIAGNFTVNGTFSATDGTISYIGTSKIIDGSGSIQLSALSISGSITTSRNLLISSNFSVSGSFTANSGLITFNGNSTFSGSADIFNIRITATETLIMGSNAELGIAGSVTLDAGGTFNTSSNVPNTVNYNSSGNQTLVFSTFHHLIVSGGSTKTPSTGLTVNGDFTIFLSTSFDALSYTHDIKGDWNNYGTFILGSSIVEFSGSSDAEITGATTFNVVEINKNTTNIITLNSDITTDSIAMTSGSLLTEANSITITNTRTGNGIILGTIIRTHTYNTSTDYAFEGPYHTVNFSSIVGTITSISITIEVGPNLTFPGAASVNRTYDITVTGGTSYSATQRFHYEQGEINGNVESAMTIWNDLGTSTWTDYSKSSNDVTNNWVELSGITDLSNLWTISEGLIKYSWNGSVDTDWLETNNWTPVGTPASGDVVHLGDLSFTNQPIINSTENIKKIYFNSTTPTTLTFASGANLTVQGNIDGLWSSDAMHTLDIGSETVSTLSDIVLSNGTSNRAINLLCNTGTINISGSLTQNGGADITFSGASNLNIQGDFNYESGTFTAGSSIVTYNGTALQNIGGVSYNDLIVSKSSGLANINSEVIVNNDLTISSSSTLGVNATTTVNGNIDIQLGNTLSFPGSDTINIGGNWNTAGTFTSGSGTVIFNGTGAQSINATSLNNLVINKASDTLSLDGNLTLNGNISVLSGSVEVGTYQVNRSTFGGTASLDSGTYVRFGGNSIQINNFSVLAADTHSTIEYYTSDARNLLPIAYGNLILNNGGANSKTMIGATTILGDLTVNSNSTLVAPSTTLTLYGDLVVNGSFSHNNGTITFNGTNKTVDGNITYNNMVINGSYDFVSGSLTIDGDLDVSSSGDFDVSSLTVIASGDFTNSGIVTSSGTVTFTGTQVQTIRLLNAITSSSSGIINFNGTISPVFNSTSSPQFATVNINNTAPITASQPWTVFVAMNVAGGSTWNGGPLTHNFLGNFTNSGTVSSNGTLRFVPTSSSNVDLGTNFTTTNEIEFGGTGVITLTDNSPTFNTVRISNTNAAGVTAGSPWIVGQDLIIENNAQLNCGTFSHTISGNFSNSGILNGETSSITFNSTAGSDAISGVGDYNFNNIIFDTNSDLDVVSNISVDGTLTNNTDSLKFLNQTVSFIGSNSSSINGTHITSFNDLVINKSASSVTIDTTVELTGFMNLTNGPFELNGNTLSITNQNPSAVARTNGYILSEDTLFSSVVSWSIGTDLLEYEFPFGTSSGDYIPFLFQLNSGDAGTVNVATYGTGSDNLPLPPTVGQLNNNGVNNSANTVDRFYHIDLVGSTNPDVDVTFNASVAEVGSIGSLQAQRWGSGWDAPLPGQVAGATSVMVPGVTQFSPWAISGNNSPLPVNLLGFNAVKQGGVVKLDWQTSEEVNNKYFDVEKSSDGIHFSKIGQVEGTNNSNQILKYSYIDPFLVNGISYYRLKQVDFNNDFSYSPLVSIKELVEDNDIIISPNPAKTNFSLIFNKPPSKEVSYTISDISGKVVNVGVIQTAGSKISEKFDCTSLAAGIYLVQIKLDNKLIVKRLIVD